MAKRLTPTDKRRIVQLFNDGWNKRAIAKKMGTSEVTIYRVLNAYDRPPEAPHEYQGKDIRTKAAQEAFFQDNPPPRAYLYQLYPDADQKLWRENKLTEERRLELATIIPAIRALWDFEFFCDRYESYRLYAHQRAWVDFFLSADHTLLCAPPRHGKTEIFSVRMPVWFLCGGGQKASVDGIAAPTLGPHAYIDPKLPLRNDQVILVSKSEDQATKNFRAITARLTLNQKILRDYGRFKAADLPWQESRGALILDGRERADLSGDYSLIVVGTGSGVLGRGGKRIICDDPFDLKNAKTPAQIEETLFWLRTEIFTRLEPDGTLAVTGARLPVTNEPYGQIEDMPIDFEDEEAIERLDVGQDYPRLFKTRVDAAVRDWDQKQVLCEERWPWPKLRQVRARVGQVVFEAAYQQSRQPPGVGLARREWIYGENGSPGCLDNHRRAGEARLPKDRMTDIHDNEYPLARVMTVDPSSTKWTAAFVMDIPKIPNRVYSPDLIDMRREKMQSPQIMDLLWAWWKEYGYRTLIVESQSSERFLVQSSEFQDFLKQTRVQFIMHFTTGHNKTDPDYGKQTLGPDFEQGLIRIPNKDVETRWKFQILIKEALQEINTDDCLMALWFPKWNLAGLHSFLGTSGWAGWSGDRGPVAAPPRLMGGVK